MNEKIITLTLVIITLRMKKMLIKIPSSLYFIFLVFLIEYSCSLLYLHQSKRKLYKMKLIVMIIGAIYGFLAIAFGAFGAHGLKKIISIEKLASFEVGVRYQIYHALFLLIIGFILKYDSALERSIAWLAIIGVMLFCGSIYLLSLSEVIKMPTKVLGPITPLGGLLLILSWLLLILAIAKQNY